MSPTYRTCQNAAVLGICAAIAMSGCGHEDTGRPQTPVQHQYELGRQAAVADLKSDNAVVYVFRSVKEGEHDPGTGLPVRDAGSDAVSPENAAFFAGYNAAVSNLRGKPAGR
jgi:hypothetical protein